MSWSTSDRRAHLPHDWRKRRAHILARDHHTCQIRGSQCAIIATEVDHIGDRDDHRAANLRAVCTPCHADRTAEQATAALRAVAARNKRPPEPHPGLVEGGGLGGM